MAQAGNFAIESDAASDLLVAELVLDDIATVQATRKGKAREGARKSDEELAFDLQAASARMLIGALNDYQFALSIDHAIETDVTYLDRVALLEQAETDDRRAALALECGHRLPSQTESQRGMERRSGESHRETRERFRHDMDLEEDIQTMNSGLQKIRLGRVESGAVSHRSPEIVESGLECIICGDGVVAGRSFKAPCAHYYCRGCVVDLVEASLRDETLYPLRCCHRPLPLTDGVFRFISTSLQVQFRGKMHEYSTPAGSRVYCSNERCSLFLGASGQEQETLFCGSCYTMTCSQCKDKVHPRKNCAEQQVTDEIREMAAANDWQTCPGCHAIVELTQGCYHITCRCSAQFCYLCSARWKTCSCRQWDERMLMDDAERRVRNEFGHRAAEAQPAIHAERVHQQMDILRENHECRRHVWTYRHGPGQCEECGDFLRVFLMRCTRCQALACRRCSVNRL